MTKYFCFVENNDWEGETWFFYVPLEYEEDALDLLYQYEEHCKKEDFENETYWIENKVFDEDVSFNKRFNLFSL